MRSSNILHSGGQAGSNRLHFGIWKQTSPALEKRCNNKMKSAQLDRCSEWNRTDLCTFVHLNIILEEWPDRCDQLMRLWPKEFSRKLAHGVQMCCSTVRAHVCKCVQMCIYILVHVGVCPDSSWNEGLWYLNWLMHYAEACYLTHASAAAFVCSLFE